MEVLEGLLGCGGNAHCLELRFELDELDESTAVSWDRDFLYVSSVELVLDRNSPFSTLQDECSGY